MIAYSRLEQNNKATVKRSVIVLAITIGVGATQSSSAQTALTGDTRLACEAILCLSTGQRPDQCTPSIARYFSISGRLLSDAIQGRINFLNLCPAASVDGNMKSLVSAIANAVGRCDAAALNTQLMTTYGGDGNGGYSISNALPANCGTYASHVYTSDLADLNPVYVGVPERNGFWVEKSSYASASAEYEARVAKEDAERAAASQGGGG